MNSNELIDAVKARLNVPSDYALAREVLKVDPTAIKDMRERGLSAERALQLATMIDIDPASVLPEIQAERARDPAVKKVWQRIAKSMRAVSGAVMLAVALLVGMLTPTPSPASDGLSSVYYVKFLFRYLFAAFRRFWLALSRFWSIFRQMTRVTAASALLAALSACGSDHDNNNGHGWEYHEIGETGLRVRYYDDSSPRLDALERVYREVAACMQMDPPPPGPLVIFTTDIIGSEGDRKPSRGYLEAQTILLDGTLRYTLPGDFWAFRHELVHLLLHVSGFPKDANVQHQSPLFTTCSAP